MRALEMIGGIAVATPAPTTAAPTTAAPSRMPTLLPSSTPTFLPTVPRGSPNECTHNSRKPNGPSNQRADDRHADDRDAD
jgi:hypothetical protein